MKKAISIILSLAMLVAFAAFSSPAFAESPATPAAVTATWHIIASSVNLRSGPGTSYSSGGNVQYGDTFTNFGVVYGEGIYWRHCKMTSGSCVNQSGYVSNMYVDFS